MMGEERGSGDPIFVPTVRRDGGRATLDAYGHLEAVAFCCDWGFAGFGAVRRRHWWVREGPGDLGCGAGPVVQALQVDHGGRQVEFGGDRG